MSPPAELIERGEPYPRDAALRIAHLPPGDEGIEHTIAMMLAAVRHDIAHPSPDLYSLAGVARTAAEVFHFARRVVRFRADPPKTEVLRTPSQIAANIIERGEHRGDCDESAALCAALLRLSGYPTFFVTVSLAPDRPYSHVFAAVAMQAQTGLYPVDPQEGFLGTWPRGLDRARVHRI